MYHMHTCRKKTFIAKSNQLLVSLVHSRRTKQHELYCFTETAWGGTLKEGCFRFVLFCLFNRVFVILLHLVCLLSFFTFCLLFVRSV